MPESKGSFALFLHTHLPFVRHPEHEYFLEEHWLFEAITECYLPLLERLYRLSEARIPWRVTCSLTPTLASMLDDSLLMEKYHRFLDRTLDLTGKEFARTRDEPAFHRLARFYRDRLTASREFLDQELAGHVLNGFRHLAEVGNLEIVTCGATHGFLPLLSVHPESVTAQVAVGVATHRRLLHREPAGIMLPECAYYEGLEEVLHRHGLRFFLLDSHGVLFSRPRPFFGVFSPVYCPNGVAAFGRDFESSRQVWSSKDGYPGDGLYREFYRDVGWDREFSYIAPYIIPDGNRTFTGIKYYRITGPTEAKEPYDPEAALARADEHAGNFLFNRERQVEHLHGLMERRPLILSPYDTELFGHWWFEGPDFLERFFRRLARSSGVLRPVTLSQYLEEEPTHQVASPCPSSWGDKGYYEVWLNGKNDWIWRYVHHISMRMTDLARKLRGAWGLQRRVLNQMAREVLLAQSSDWPFLMTMGTAMEYSTRRFRDHLERFWKLEAMAEGKVDEGALADIEGKDNIFPDIDFRVFG